MKPFHALLPIALAGTLGLLLTGCLFRPVTGSARRFVLVPLAPPGATSAGGEQVSLGIRPVSMPPYLTRTPLALRKGASEIRYLPDALWAEPLDQGFQRTLAANLSRLLPTEQLYLSGWEPGQAKVQLFVAVEQFDVDTQGRGKLIAWWRVTRSGSDKPVKSGQVNLAHTGPSPRGNPQAVVTTLSTLTAQFSSELAEAIRAVAPTGARTGEP